MNKILLALLLVTGLHKIGKAQPEFEFTNFNQTTSPELGGNNFKCVAVGRGGYIWAGSQYHGIVQYDTATKQWVSSVELAGLNITDIKADQKGNIWVANAGQAGLVNGGSNIGGGVSKFLAEVPNIMNFYTITGVGNLTSRNVRSLWIDKFHPPATSARVWAAQGTFVVTNTTRAGGFSVGDNGAPPYFTKGYIGLQVTPYVVTSQAGTPSCLAVGGSKDEVWIFAQTNFGRNQLLRYRADTGPHAFLGVYDYTNTPVLTSGFRANAIFFDDLGRGWLGLNQDGIIIKSGSVWKTMNDPSIFPSGTSVNPNAIASDAAGNVYIGTNNGLVIYRGGPVDLATSYRRLTTANGLPTNMINGIAEDTLRKTIVLAHNAGISFMKYNKKVNSILDWDFSFPKLNIKPKGVTADGVSRLYVKVKRNSNNSQAFKKVTVAIKNASGVITRSILGKLKVATILDRYSNEANTGSADEVSRTDSTSSGEYIFWYVAPEDFSADSLSSEANLAEREDSIKVKVTYMDDSEDSSYLPVKIQRPPLMIVSGIKKLKDALQSFKQTDGVPFMESDKIGSKTAVEINVAATLLDNASRLIDGDRMENEDKKSSFQGSIEKIRQMGFACNRVDYIGQGLGGLALRAAQAIKQAKFYADGDYPYNNYGKGYVNKFISVGVPHNGSPVFDMIKDVASNLNEIVKKQLAKAIKANPDLQDPYEFFKPKDSSLAIASELLRKAMMDTSGFSWPAMQVKNHMIVSDADVTGTNFEETLVSLLVKFCKKMEGSIMALRDATAQQSLKDSLTNLFKNDVTQKDRIIRAINNYAATKGISNFIGDGDLIGSLASQAANALMSAPHVTKVNSNKSSELVHQFVFSSQAMAKKIQALLNSSVNNAAFSNSIPAKIRATASNIAQKISKVFYDTSKVVTDDREIIENSNFRPTNNSSTLSDTTIRLKFRVKDTARLQYIFITFQDTMYTTTSKQRNQEVMLKIKKDYDLSGIQEITAVGVYETADSVKYHADTISTYVTTTDSIQGFRVTADEVQLYDGKPYYPAYEIKVADKWKVLPATDTLIKFSFEVPEIAAYDSTQLAFNTKKDGFTRVYFRFKTFRDTVAFDCLLSQDSTGINRTVINGNFKDSSTWSKGRPPLPGDSIIISAGHTIVLDSSVQVRSLRIDSLGTLTLNNAARSLQLGDAEDGDFMVDNFGTLNIHSGTLTVKGRVKLNRGSRFNMTGGNLVIDGNTGNTISSLQNGLFLFEAAPAMQSFAFTGGTLQIIDPPLGVASQAISCPYNFGINSILILGNGISLTASENPNGFGGPGFPPQIGRLILDAGIAGSNRQLKITQPLNVKGSFEIRTGSNLLIQAQTRVTQ